ncbi:cyclic beta-1,2-glucan synthase [Hoeflea marina]|uniref:Cyclic beta-1,2-glucan synthase n=1 Tax=Hoeflea marina TaxID=274592 RepID=A0A317PTT1_9HYPH|nr:glucoamylase family protein [Hoeflea marina]PWW04074.1 cyclic beta-1,2-glucan synthase [Hoeflea marina]
MADRSANPAEEPVTSISAASRPALPIRYEFWDGESLFKTGRDLAEASAFDLPAYVPVPYAERLRSNQQAIRANYVSILKATREQMILTPAAEWLLDNHHVVDENFRHLKRDLSLKFYRQLPAVPALDGPPVPRALGIVWTYIACCNSEVSLKTLTEIVNGFQASDTLTIGEIWAIPSLLRFVLLENLRRLSDRVELARQRRSAANRLADRLASSDEHEAVLIGHNGDVDDDTFAAQLLYRFRDGPGEATMALTWLEGQLARRGSSPDLAVQTEHNRQSSGNVTTGNIIRSLKLVDDIDWLKWFESVSRIDEVLRDGTDYDRLDKATRNDYRNAIERIARRSPIEEIEVARIAIRLAGGLEGECRAMSGHFLAGKRIHELEEACSYRPTWTERLFRTYRKAGWLGILIPGVTLSLAMVALAAYMLPLARLNPGFEVLLLVLFFFPASEAASGLVNFFASRLIRPSRLPGYDYSAGIPRESRTLVVIPCMITNIDTIDELARNLELHYLANSRGEVYFALLSDWRDSGKETTPEDDALLDHARKRIAELAERYAHTGARRFFLLHRRRLFNPQEEVWMGWERKRGKLSELNQLLRGDMDTTFLPSEAFPPADIRYVLTLDSDTRLPRDSVPELVAKMAHPINHAICDPETGAVTSGYSILQPRVTPSLTTGEEASLYQRTFSVNRGMDPYVFTVSDVYQDLLDEGSFTGKGLYDVDSFEAAVGGKIDENTVLSHDLLEGAFARAALVTDVQFVEDFPIRYEVDRSRQHRWVRGDWQLLPFIFDLGNGIGATSRMKMVDNLRRSVVPVTWVAASLAGWLLLDYPSAALWQFSLMMSMIVTPAMNFNATLMPSQPGVSIARHLRSLAIDAAAHIAEIALRLTFLMDQAASMIDAIIRTQHRLHVSRKHLLEWRSAQQVHQEAKSGAVYYARMMAVPSLAALVFLALVAAFNPQNLLLAAPFCLIWILAPLAALYVSRTLETEDRLQIRPEDAAELRKFARETWRYFEAFVDADNNFLPPDNFQEIPQPKVAERTSPTNIGLYMMSVLSARDLGWISFKDAILRLGQTLATIEKMDKHKGHLFNWYDTRSLAVLEPRYVSSVDSGNLAGYLIAIASALREWSGSPSVYMFSNLDGIGDTLQILREKLDQVPAPRKALRPLRSRLISHIEGFNDTYMGFKSSPELAPMRSISLSVVSEDIRKLARDFSAEINTPASRDMAWWAGALKANCEASIQDAVIDMDELSSLRAHLSDLAERARALAFKMDFRFLMNQERNLLSIGFRPGEQELDNSCYDLLASEARLASFFAIAKGDLPNEHWFRLGRPVTPVGMSGALVSWSGSMFEYLMPPLIMHEPVGGLLSQSNIAAINRQITYGDNRGIPWGVSESAFNARDREMNYQYHSFGVPALGLKRDLAEDVVIAPYASAMATQYRPRQALRNLRALEALGAKGIYGFYDAVDYTPSRVPEGEKSAIVRNYMAHHQGMALVAITNAVMEGIHRSRFHADQVVQAAALLLQEKAPREIVPVTQAPESASRSDGAAELPGAGQQIISNPLHAPRQIAILSNGRYSTMITATGSGYSRFDGLAVTRWRPDPTLDDYGVHLFIRDMETGNWWSATPGPCPAAVETAHASFTDDRAEFHKIANQLESRVECIVASEANAEGRRLTIRNRSDRERMIEITSYGEIVLERDDADLAHPAFSKMFIKTEILTADGVILASRNKRTEHDRKIYFAHLFSESVGVNDLQAETDRRAFIGRGRSLRNPAAFDAGARLGGSDGFTLDPVFSLRRVLRIPAGQKVSLVMWNIVTEDLPARDAAVAHYRRAETFDHESRLAWTHSQIQLRHVSTTMVDAELFRRYASFIVYPDTSLRHQDSEQRAQMLPQSALWALGISGDAPIMVIRIDNEADLPIVRKAVAMQEYLRIHGVEIDVAVINERSSSYTQDLQNQIAAIVDVAVRRGPGADKRHMFALRKDLMGDTAWSNLLAIARIVLHARNGKLSEQLKRFDQSAAMAAEPDYEARPATPLLAPPHSSYLPVVPVHGFPDEELAFFNGIGGFSADKREYVVRLRQGDRTPHPWINVISGKQFGFHVSAGGAGFTWARNSRDYQISPWSNDPVINRPGEAFHVVDLPTGRIAAPFACLSDDPGAIFEARHGMGYSRFRSWQDWLSMDVTQTLAGDRPAKLTRITLTNPGERTLKLRVFGYVELVLGNNRSRTVTQISAGRDGDRDAIAASNPYSVDFADREMSFSVDRPLSWWTVSREEFLGHGGSLQRPRAVAHVSDLPGRHGTGGDPCAALATDITIEPGATATLCFALEDRQRRHDDAAAVAAPELTAADVEGFQAKSSATWENFLQTLQVETPDSKLDLMVNTWLPYQSLACRINARSAFYQASGAFGFRDQLQDTAALLLHDPSLARFQIINAASRQFEEGDVQHWWLPATGAGVRTMISDDVVWLGHCTAGYVDATGDSAILDEQIAFIKGDPLAPGQHDAFFVPERSGNQAPLYEHCARALDLAIKRTGSNGLPLMLGGDWNDGMNQVGEGGRGESVWLGWFLADTLEAFLPHARRRDDTGRVDAWTAHRTHLAEALESAGWDGDWYRRAYYDDGTPLGSATSDECRIDSLGQSWAALSGVGDSERTETAMNQVLARLVDRDNRIIRLFTPAFEKTERNPGYIKGYPPGVRENGGQYTHAATWVVMALARLGRGNDAHACFDLINPITHSLTREEAETYRTEPYVVAADIYGEGDRAGRGGWTWYTGSAGWLYRAAVEGILGISVRDGEILTVRPAVPDEWPGFSARITLLGRPRDLKVVRSPAGGYAVTLDGVASQDGVFDLSTEGALPPARVG